MSNDRELLMLAAKAAGFKEPALEDGSWLELRYGLTVAIWDKAEDGIEGYWNPLEDDGHALRLAVYLGLDLLRTERDIEAIATLPPYAPMERNMPAPCAVELIDDAPYGATRRAIVRAAAAIGKSMP